MRRTQAAIASFEDEGREPQTKECGQQLEGEGEETNSPLEPPEKSAALPTP